MIDDEKVHGLTLNQAMEEMRGPIDTTLKLTWRQRVSKAAKRRLGHCA
jgi:hypothetical protein